MGVFKKHSGVSAPDPKNFTIQRCIQVRRLYVSEVHYPSASNYEGNKILVTQFDPRFVKTLDPHFDKYAGILARFEPTKKGFEMASKVAELWHEN